MDLIKRGKMIKAKNQGCMVLHGASSPHENWVAANHPHILKLPCTIPLNALSFIIHHFPLSAFPLSPPLIWLLPIYWLKLFITNVFTEPFLIYHSLTIFFNTTHSTYNILFSYTPRTTMNKFRWFNTMFIEPKRVVNVKKWREISFVVLRLRKECVSEPCTGTAMKENKI